MYGAAFSNATVVRREPALENASSTGKSVNLTQWVI